MIVVGILVIGALAMAAMGLSIVTVCAPTSSHADCDQLKRLIAIDFFGEVVLGVIAVVVLCLNRFSWRARTLAVGGVAGLAIVFDVVLRHLIAGSPAH